MNQFKNLLLETFEQFWDERQGRERQYIITAVFFVLATLIYMIGIDPALTGRDELSKRLPTLHIQSLEMQQMALELQSLPSTENMEDVTRDSVDESLKRANLKPQSLSVVEGVVRLQISSTSMAALQTWLLEMQKNSALFVQEMRITGQEAGMVSATMMLQQSNRGG